MDGTVIDRTHVPNGPSAAPAAASPTVLDALLASPVAPILNAPLPAPPTAEPVLFDPLLPPPEIDAIVDLVRSIPVPPLPDLEALTKPLTDLASLFGTGIPDGLDPAAILQQGSRLLEAATALGRSALHALPESWSGSAADRAADHGVRARQAALELTDRGDRIGVVTRAATATVERGNVELAGIVQSFVATATAAVPVLATPPGQAALLASAAEHVGAALAVVARTRGELSVHTASMAALTAPIPVPAPAAVGIPGEVRHMTGAVTDVASGIAAPFTSAAGYTSTVPSSFAGTTPTSHLPLSAPGAATSVPTALSTGPAVGYSATAGAGAMGGVGAMGVPATPPLPGTAPPTTAGTPATTASSGAGRGPMMGGMTPATPGARDDEEHRPDPSILSSAGKSTDVVGDLPLVTPAVIGSRDEW